MNAVLAINSLTGFVLAYCAVLSIRLIRSREGYRTSVAIVGVIILIKSFVVIGNLLEHGLGVLGPDRIEEYLEISLPLLYFLFVVSYSLQDSYRTIEAQKSQLKRWNADLEAEVGRKVVELEKIYSELADARISLINRDRAASFDQVIRKISHLLNTPLGICITSASALDEECPASAEQTLGLLRRSLSRIVGLTTEIRRVLELRTEEEKSRFSLAPIVDEVAKEIMGETSVPFTYAVIGGKEPLYGYRENLKKVFRELMINSVIHNLENSNLSIDVELALEGGRAVLRFRDNGRGIPAEFADKVFDPFSTPSLSDTRLGLGLFMVRSIVQNVFNGDVVISPAEEGGAAFSVSMPASELSAGTGNAVPIAVEFGV